MSLEVEGETYFTASEAAEYLKISRDTFYENVKDKLQQYKPGALKRVYYRKSDLDKFKGLHPTEPEQRNVGDKG